MGRHKNDRVHYLEAKLGGVMNLTLSDDEVETLRGLLSDFLPQLKFEMARTHGSELLHVLVKRETLCERLLEELRAASTPPQLS